MHRPLNSHVVLATSPIAPVALVPRLPTIAASMYCMIVALIWARMEGILSLMMSTIISRNASGRSPRFPKTGVVPEFFSAIKFLPQKFLDTALTIDGDAVLL